MCLCFLLLLLGDVQIIVDTLTIVSIPNIYAQDIFY